MAMLMSVSGRQTATSSPWQTPAATPVNRQTVPGRRCMARGGRSSRALRKNRQPDHPIREIWRLWEEAQSEPDEARRNELFTQMLDIHKEHPYMLGTVGESPQLFIVKNNVGNIQTGHVWDDTLRSPGGVNPITWYFKA